MQKALLCLLVYLLLRCFCRFESYLEHKARKDTLPIVRVYVKWSLSFFKVSRSILLALASIEAVYFGRISPASFCLGLTLISVGIIMRILAIIELGPMWSFNVAHVVGHKKINTGIYRFFKHPAYIGNMYIVGLFLTIGSTNIALASLIFIFIFFFIRSSYEEKLLRHLGD